MTEERVLSADGLHNLIATEWDWGRYMNDNPDVCRVFRNCKEGAEYHFSNYGKSEGRRIYIAPGAVPVGIVCRGSVIREDNIDHLRYFNDYPDVSGVYGSSGRIGAWNHFLNYGHVEGRVAYISTAIDPTRIPLTSTPVSREETRVRITLSPHVMGAPLGLVVTTNPSSGTHFSSGAVRTAFGPGVRLRHPSEAFR